MSICSRLISVSTTMIFSLPLFSYPHYSNIPETNSAAPVTENPLDAAPHSGIDQLIPAIIIQGDLLQKSLNFSPLEHNRDSENPLGENFHYPTEFAKLDFEQVKEDMKAIMVDSKEYWPADYGHYGPLFIRMAWHSAGTYRALDGRGGSDGGQMRFYPLADWPDNANLDKARKLIQPVVDKYYPMLSWADAMILAGDLAIQDMGFETLGFAGGRVDDWKPDLVYWGPEDEFLKSERFDKDGKLQLPLAASVMGLIYVNPEGPDGKPDPLLAAERIRTTFGRMGMNDEETAALIAGGHTFGKTHGAPKPKECLEAEGAKCEAAKGPYTNTSGIEGPWTPSPITWTHKYLTNLYKYEWELSKGPGGKYQWFAKDLEDSDYAPDAHDPTKLVPITMLTTDLALRFDPKYQVITKKFLEDPDAFGSAFARAWFKLIHRDLGPKSRYLGSDFADQNFLWQDPIPQIDHNLVSSIDVESLKNMIKSSGLSIPDRIKTAWAGAVTYRGTDMRGGINGARLRLQPQINWEVNEPSLLKKNIAVLEEIQKKFNQSPGVVAAGKKITLADLIVLAGNTAVEEAALKAGYRVEVPFFPGRADATQKNTDISSFSFLEVKADGFRNYYNPEENYMSELTAFIDRASLLELNKQQMVVLTGGLRVLGANYRDSKHGVFTKMPGALTNDYFKNLLDRKTRWFATDSAKGVYVGKDFWTGKEKWTATKSDLIFGSSAELRQISYLYSGWAAKKRFVIDFVDAWTKVMNLDRFDLKN